MAQKTYTMDFVLNAVLNGGFSGVFSQAQQKFAQLGNEIKHLQSVQRDITSYQKQSQAVANTTQKLQNLQSQQAKVREQIEALKSIQGQDSDEKARNKAQVAELEREYLKYEQNISKVSDALERQKQKQSEVSDRLQAAGVDTNALGEKSAELTARQKELEAEQKKLNEELAKGGDQAQSFGEKGERAIDTVATALAAAGVAAGLKKIADGFMACVEAAGEFGSAMSAVEAISDASESEMAALTEKAKETGLTTVYTAQQSANAMEYMAMAGWEAQEMLAGMSGMVNLAAAAGEDLAEVSDIVTDNLTAFGMEASETGHFADVLAQAAANSNTNIHKMGESFKNSSAVAGALGYSVEDVAVSLGLMANNAVKGTRAGTALRNIFNGFAQGMTLSAQSFGDVEVSAVNADGSIKGFMDTIRELRGYFSQMTGAEKIQNAMDIAGLRGYNGLLAIVNATDADFEKLYGNINNCTGAAERMAKVKLDNMKGDLTIAKSAWEGLTIAVGEQFEPEMREVYQVSTDVFNVMSDFVREHPALVKMLAGAVTGIMGVVAALTAYAAAKKVAAALELSSLFTSGVGATLVLVGAVGALVGGLFGMSDAAGEGKASLSEMTEETRAATQAMEDAKKTYEDMTEEALATANVAEHYLEKLEDLERQGKRSNEANSEYQNTLAILVQTMPELESQISKTTDEFGRSIYAIDSSTSAIRANIQAIKDRAMTTAAEEYLQEQYASQVKIMVEEQRNQIKLLEYTEKKNAADQKKAELQAKINKLTEDYNKQQDAERKAILNGEDYTPTFGGTLYDSQEYKDLSDALGQAIAESDEWARQIETTEEALEDNREATEEARAEVDLATEAVERWKEATGDHRELTEADKAALEKLNPTIGVTLGNIQTLTTAYTEVRDAAHDSITSQYKLWEEAAKRNAIAIEEITKAQGSQETYWGKFTDDLNTLMEKVRSGEYAGLAEMIQEITAGGATPDAVNAIAGLAQATDKELKDAIQAWKDNKDAISEAADAMALFTVDMETQVGTVVELVDGMATEVENKMDLSAEAKAAALETISGYVAGLNAGLNDPALNTALAQLQTKIKLAATGAYNKQPMMSGYYSDFDKQPKKLMNGVYSDWWSGEYAQGTTNAAPGWAIVGEEGPELVRMRGGEAVFPTAQTEEMLTGGGGQRAYYIKIEAEGGANAQAISQVVRDTIEEIEEDKRRRDYT